MTESNGNYITNKELLLEIRAEVRALSAVQHSMDLRYTTEMSRRPTRGEIITWLGGAGVISGIFFGVIQALSG